MSDERIRILNLVRDGKITPQEALALMEALAGEKNMITELVEQADGSEPRAESQDNAGDQNSAQQATWEVNLQKSISNALRHVEKASGKVLEKAPLFTEQVVEQLAEQAGKLGEKLTELGWRQSATGMSVMGAIGNRIDVVETYSGVFTASEAHITISNHNGGIKLKAWDESGYKVIITKRVIAADQVEAERLSQGIVRVEASDDALTIQAGTDMRITVLLDIFLPQGKLYHLSTETTNGGIVVDHLRCTTCKADTTNGAVTMAHINADKVDLNTTNGAVVGDQIKATQTDVETTNGQIRWTGAAQVTNLETTNGAVRVYCLEPPNADEPSRYHLETTNGSVEVHLLEATAQAEVHFDAVAAFGRIQVPADSRIVQRSEAVGAQRLTAELPGSTKQRLDIVVKTSHGAVQLYR
jgi:DUF4097 and DUF4098 domain-containing protein YvlB